LLGLVDSLKNSSYPSNFCFPRHISAIFGVNFCYPNHFITIFSILDKFKQLSIAHDMTKKERLQNREKLAEAKNKYDVLEENNQWVKYKYCH
jgi:hypothetical protein